MDERLFRKAALDRLASPERLDRLPSLAPPGTWLWWAAIGVLIVAAVIVFLMGSPW